MFFAWTVSDIIVFLWYQVRGDTSFGQINIRVTDKVLQFPRYSTNELSSAFAWVVLRNQLERWNQFIFPFLTYLLTNFSLLLRLNKLAIFVLGLTAPILALVDELRIYVVFFFILKWPKIASLTYQLYSSKLHLCFFPMTNLLFLYQNHSSSPFSVFHSRPSIIVQFSGGALELKSFYGHFD